MEIAVLADPAAGGVVGSTGVVPPPLTLATIESPVSTHSLVDPRRRSVSTAHWLLVPVPDGESGVRTVTPVAAATATCPRPVWVIWMVAFAGMVGVAAAAGTVTTSCVALLHSSIAPASVAAIVKSAVFVMTVVAFEVAIVARACFTPAARLFCPTEVTMSLGLTGAGSG